jgi:hypothetical protein
VNASVNSTRRAETHGEHLHLFFAALKTRTVFTGLPSSGESIGHKVISTANSKKGIEGFLSQRRGLPECNRREVCR